MSKKRNKSILSVSQQGAGRYALAFFRVIQGDRLEPIMAEYRMVLELVEAYPDLPHVLNHMLLTDEEKDVLLGKILDTCQVSVETSSFLKMLVAKRHMDWLRPICESLQELVDKENNKMLAHVKTAVKLTEVQTEKILKKLEVLTKSEIDLVLEQDPNILGGIVARVGDRIFDLSIQNRLGAIKEKMAN